MTNQKVDTSAKVVQVVSEIAGMLKERGHEIEMGRTDKWTLPSIARVDGVYVGLQLYAESSSSSFRETGKLRMRMSEGGNSHKRKNYPEPKVGFANPKTIERIEHVLAVDERAKRENAKRAKQQNAAGETLKKAAGLLGKEEHYGSFYMGTATVKTSSEAKVRLECHVTPEQLVRIAKILGE